MNEDIDRIAKCYEGYWRENTEMNQSKAGMLQREECREISEDIGLVHAGQGGGRDVFIDGNTVIKFARHSLGAEDNGKEVEFYGNVPDIDKDRFASIEDSGVESYVYSKIWEEEKGGPLWVRMERADPIGSKRAASRLNNKLVKVECTDLVGGNVGKRGQKNVFIDYANCQIDY